MTATVPLSANGTGTAIGHAVDRIIDPVQGMHEAIAGPIVSLAGPQVATAHRAATRTAYSSVRLAGWAAGAGTEALLHRRGNDGSAVRATIEALWGDVLHDRDEYPSPAIELERRTPEATENVVVLVHGLGERGSSWNPDFLAQLEASGHSAIVVRYNTGRSVHESGGDLAAALVDMVREWPVDVRQLAFVGYSMGGLVARSAITSLESKSHPWTAPRLKLATIGTPHRGSPIAKAAALAATGLEIAPHTRPLARFLRGRSAGLHDLDHGAAARNDTLDAVDVLAIAGVISASANSPIGILFGDSIVRRRSALGDDRRTAFAPTTEHVVTNRSHFSLMDAPEVHDSVIIWLGAA